jgi:hypothetical protein
MWLLLALAAALFQVLRNTAMKRLGHAPNLFGVTGVALSGGGVYLLDIRRARVSAGEPLRVLATDPVMVLVALAP